MKSIKVKPNKNGKVKATSFDRVSIEAAAINVAAYVMFREGKLQFDYLMELNCSPDDEMQSELAKSLAEELRQRLGEVIGVLLGSLLTERMWGAKHADDIVIWKYVFLRFHKYQWNDISSDQGKELWKTVWEQVIDHPLIQKQKAMATTRGIHLGKQTLTFRGWQADVRQRALNEFNRFGNIYNRALTAWPDWYAKIIATDPLK